MLNNVYLILLEMASIAATAAAIIYLIHQHRTPLSKPLTRGMFVTRVALYALAAGVIIAGSILALFYLPIAWNLGR